MLPCHWFYQGAPIPEAAFRRAFAEWQYCEHEMERLAHLSALDCPACSNGMFAQHEDGNFKAFSWNRGYEKDRQVYYDGGYLFSPDADVQEHLAMIDAALGKEEVTRFTLLKR